jgi:hypothetical protein
MICVLNHTMRRLHIIEHFEQKSCFAAFSRFAELTEIMTFTMVKRMMVHPLCRFRLFSRLAETFHVLKQFYVLSIFTISGYCMVIRLKEQNSALSLHITRVVAT